MTFQHAPRVVPFVTDLGWMALAADDDTVKHLVFGYRSEGECLAAIRLPIAAVKRPGRWARLVERLQDYAAGGAVDFRDVPVDLEHLTPFQQRVVKHCRAIGYGQTRSYADLARASGSARAARAVGNTMACNRYPLIIPCHRVITADGRIGHFSSPDGPHMKARLLAMEGRDVESPIPVDRAPKARRGAQVVRG